MALPLQEATLQELDNEVAAFFWTKQKDGETIQKRKLVAKGRIPADYNMGGLKVPQFQTTAEGFRLNLLQKILRKEEKPTHFPKSHLPGMLDNLLRQLGRPSLLDHVERLGPTQWHTTANNLSKFNIMFSQAFQAGSQLLQHQETDKDLWHLAPIVGHTKDNIFKISVMEANLLHRLDVIAVGQLY